MHKKTLYLTFFILKYLQFALQSITFDCIPKPKKTKKYENKKIT